MHYYKTEFNAELILNMCISELVCNVHFFFNKLYFLCRCHAFNVLEFNLLGNHLNFIWINLHHENKDFNFEIISVWRPINVPNE